MNVKVKRNEDIYNVLRTKELKVDESNPNSTNETKCEIKAHDRNCEIIEESVRLHDPQTTKNKHKRNKYKMAEGRQKSYAHGNVLQRRRNNRRRNKSKVLKSSLIKDPEFQEEYVKMLKTKIKVVKRQDSKDNLQNNKGYDIKRVDFQSSKENVCGFGNLTPSVFKPNRFFPIR